MKIAIFAAGTGGHIYPALSIAENFKKDEVLFFASNRELEKQIYAVSDFKVIHLKVSGFRGKSLLEKIFFPFNLLINLFKVIFEGYLVLSPYSHPYLAQFMLIFATIQIILSLLINFFKLELFFYQKIT